MHRYTKKNQWLPILARPHYEEMAGYMPDARPPALHKWSRELFVAFVFLSLEERQARGLGKELAFLRVGGFPDLTSTARETVRKTPTSINKTTVLRSAMQEGQRHFSPSWFSHRDDASKECLCGSDGKVRSGKRMKTKEKKTENQNNQSCLRIRMKKRSLRQKAN